MKSITSAKLLLAFVLLALASEPSIVHAQSTTPVRPGAPGNPGQRSTTITGEVERAGAQLQLILTNQGDKQAFQGKVSVGVLSSTDEIVRFEVTLSPKEKRRIPLSLSASTNDQYSLTVADQAGTIVLHKISTIKPGAGNEMNPTPGKAAALKKDSGELKVSARLTRGLVSRNAELPTVGADEPFLLTFEIESPAPIQNANLALESKSFQRQQKITVQTRAELEFKLPETLSERKLKYALTTEAGQQIARGEIDLDRLTAAESVTVSAMTFDRPAYAPGESARAVIEIQGDASNEYRLEVTVKNGGGNLFFKTERRGSNSDGKSRQELMLEIPREAKGPIILAYQVFGGQTGTLFDSGERAIILKESQDEKASAGKRLSP